MHQRAITEGLPEEISSVATQQNGRVNLSQPHGYQPELPAKVVPFPSREAIAENAALTSQDNSDSDSSIFFSSSLISVSSNQAQLITKKASAPTNSDGFAENPNAYRIWQPKPVEGEPLEPERVREKLAAHTFRAREQPTHAVCTEIMTRCTM